MRATFFIGSIRLRNARSVHTDRNARAQLSERRNSQDHFITSVLSSPRIFVNGNERELEAMGR